MIVKSIQKLTLCISLLAQSSAFSGGYVEYLSLGNAWKSGLDEQEFQIFDEDQKFLVDVDDQITDGCWSNPNSAKTAVELELKRSGRLADKNIEWEKMFAKTIYLEGFGFAIGSSKSTCVVTLEAAVYSYREVVIGRDLVKDEITDEYHYERIITATGLSTYLLGDGGGTSILTGSKDSMSTRIKNTLVEKIQHMLLETNTSQKTTLINAVREKALIEFPDSSEKFNKMVDRLP